MVIIPGKNKHLAARFYANLIDYVIFIIFFIVYVRFAGEQQENGNYQVTGLKFLPIPIAWFLYFPLCEGIAGQTLGKKLLGLYVVDFKGETPTIGHTFVRRMVDIFECITFGVLALITINYSKRNQRLGDMMAGTTVIKTDAICRFCGSTLELSTREVMRETFTCPDCNQLN